ncbi:WD REPEATS REGION domain-containing protein [Citrus sinensis]|uniref:WD REPEATS REGION domain-containing protein n=1 Tax=Citrus sinensis TaxID=2711 RepID=A0ACB8P2D6_CITSI|nr:WD REPEATS REGION domain-containing protein [Citrus sinensis]
MSHHHADDAEYMADEYDMEDIDDDMDEEFRGRDMGGSDSDVDEYDYSNNKIADTSAAQARRGKDIQGIPWERLSITREKYRQTRLEQYKNYENIPNSGEGSGKDCKVTKKGASYYEFRRNSRSVKSTILHFQCHGSSLHKWTIVCIIYLLVCSNMTLLRNLVWATSKHDVYLMSHFSVIHWSSLTSSRSQVLNVSGHVAPSEKHPGSLLEGFTQTQVSTLAVKDKLLVAGGFQGELICKHLDRPGVSFCSRTTYDDNAITNAVEIYGSPSGAVHFTASNNDCGVRDFDMGKYQLSKHFRFPWPVNTTASLCGHLDFSFASAWHPDGVTFATGNQDKTCRIWDLRNLSESVAVLKGNLGAIRSIRYTSDGRYMATAEPADFVHVYDVKSGYEKEQEIDFFGEISGISFSPDTESLFIGVWDRTYGSLLEYGRCRNYSYLDSLI